MEGKSSVDGKNKKPWEGVLLGGAGHLKGLLCRWEEVWFPSCHSLMSLPLQVSNDTKQDTIAAALEWQRKLEAAEALLALRNSPLPPPVSASPRQRGNMPNSYLPGRRPRGGETWEVGWVVVIWLYLGTLSLNCLGSDN